jgi:alpha-L-arabinofuranosidase
MGTGTIEEARRWVEYYNVKEGPYFAELRKKHGYPEPPILNTGALEMRWMAHGKWDI